MEMRRPFRAKTEASHHADEHRKSGADIRIGGDMAFYSPSHDFIQFPAVGFQPSEAVRVLDRAGEARRCGVRVSTGISLADMVARLMPARNSSLNSAPLSSAPSSVSPQLFAMRTTSAPGWKFSKDNRETPSRQPRWRQRR